MGTDADRLVMPAPGAPAGPPNLNLHDIATMSPLQLSRASQDALTKTLSSVPPDAMAVNVTATDANGGEVGIGVAVRLGERWSVGLALNLRKEGADELAFGALVRF